MSGPNIKTISCQELYRLGQNGPIELIDVRTPEEFAAIRAEGARNIPLDAFDPATVVRGRESASDEPLYFICAVGGRSAWACELMMAAGYENVFNVEGGTQEWAAAGLPLKHGV